jgi:hypothetical protein
MFKNISFFAAFLLIFVSSLQAQPNKNQTNPDKDSELTDLLKKSETLVINLKASIPENKEDFFLLDNTEYSLKTLIKISENSDFSPNYVMSVKINELSLLQYQSKRDTKTLKIVSSDYATKASFAERNKNEAFQEIRVTAFTINSASERVGAFTVSYRETGKVKTILYFGQTTKPATGATRRMVSGDYYFAAKNGDIESIKPDKVYNIGTNTFDSEDGLCEAIDIKVP